MRLTDDLDRVILAAVSDDFTTLEFIAEKLSFSPDIAVGKLDAEALLRRLLQLIGEKHINAYLLHADPPFITPIEIGDKAALATCWFYITQRGRKFLLNSAGKRRPHIRSTKLNLHGRSYSSAANF
jgi:hypothetical protein